MVHTALKVASRLSEHGISASVVDLFDLQGVNESSLAHTLSEFNGVVSFEEGFKNRGGLDARMREILDGLKNNLPYRAIGVDPGYRFELGTREELHETVGIGEEASVDSVLKFYNSLPK
jgi:transketolase